MNDKLPERADTLANCYSHFKQHGGSLEALAQFTKAPRNTVRRWNKDRLPLGEASIRLQYFLLMQDYSLIGFRTMNQTLFRLGQCIAFDLVSCDSVVQATGFYNERNLFACFRGTSGISRAKLEIIERMCEKHQLIIPSKIADFTARYRPGSSDKPSIHSSARFDAHLIENFAAACETVRKFGNKLLDGPIEDRIEMRKKMGQGGEPPLHLTWEVLNKLLSEPFVKLETIQ
jgi:hypothetical protein